MATASNSKKRILSGMRSTGKLHLGNYVGALANWVKLQDGGQYDCFFFIADWHALTTDYADTSMVKQNSLEVAIDWLAAGLNPEKCTLFVQSHVPQHAELHLLFSMITPLGWLERVPTYKEQQQNLKDKDLNTYGFLGYPVLQAADILLYSPGMTANPSEAGIFVPVGEDQVAHIELTREIGRRFNQFYFYDPSKSFPPKKETSRQFALCDAEPLLTPSPRLRGSDGRKMSKSYGNAIFLSDSPEQIERRLNSYITDRSEMQEPGEPTRCPVGDLHSQFSDSGTLERAFGGCRTATISCSECKSLARENLVRVLTPIRTKREELHNDPAAAWAVMLRGSEKARDVAGRTMQNVRELMGLTHTFDSLIDAYPWATLRKSTYLELPFDEIEQLPEHSQRGDARRVAWIRWVNRWVNLRKTDVHRVYTTPRNKRVCVVSSGEREADHSFVFLPRDRSYEVLTLLFHLRSGRLVDFVIPQSSYLGFWKRLERDKKSVRIEGRRSGERFFLETPDGPFELEPYKSKYDPLQ